jgi:hypothetical protein
LFGLLIADTIIYRRSNASLPKQILRNTAIFAGIFLIGLSILWAFYGFRYRAIPNANAETISVARYIKENGRPEMVESVPAKITRAISRTRTFPESYVLGVADVIAWGSRNTWIFGRSYATGQWWYFPLAFTVKSSIALLLLLPLALLFSFLNREKRREMMFLLVPPLAFFAVALTSSFTTGVRHILPVYGFFIVSFSSPRRTPAISSFGLSIQTPACASNKFTAIYTLSSDMLQASAPFNTIGYSAFDT